MEKIIVHLLHSFVQVLIWDIHFGVARGCICICDFLLFLFLFHLWFCDSAQYFEVEPRGLILVLKFIFIFLIYSQLKYLIHCFKIKFLSKYVYKFILFPLLSIPPSYDPFLKHCFYLILLYANLLIFVLSILLHLVIM